MDDPNIIPNSTGVVVDQTDSMASLSPSKRTIALGVVNTSGMKSANMNRKRRWDQPPDESGDTPCVKKVHLNEHLESPDCSERLSDESVEMPDKCDALNFNESENLVLHGEQFLSDGNAMSIDLPPDEVCDRLAPVETSGVTSSSEHNKCESTVTGGLSECSDSVSVEKVNSLSSDLRLGNMDIDKETETPSKPVSENPVVIIKEKNRKSSTVISHQSDELRRIMFSYDEGTSESDSNDSNALSSNPDATDNKTDKVIPVLENCEDISKLESNDKINEPNNEACALNDNRLVPDEKENSLPDKNLPKQSQNADSNSFNDVDSIEMTESSIIVKTESHLNIPNKRELLLNSTEVNCVDNSDNLLPETNNTPKSGISSVKSDEVHNVNAYIEEGETSNSNIECDKTPEINIYKVDKVEADSTKICEDKVFENCNEFQTRNEIIKNVPVDSVTEQIHIDGLSDCKKENFSDPITGNIKIVPQVNNVDNERTIERPELNCPNVLGDVSSEPSNLNPIVSDKEGCEDSHETEQLPNLHNAKENSIEIHESCLDDVNSNTLKPEMEEPVNEVMSGVESTTHLKTINDNSHTLLESTDIDNDSAKNCTNLDETVDVKKLFISEIVPDSNKSLINFNKISEKSVEIEKNEVNEINKQDDKEEGGESSVDVLPSNSIDPDVMNVIFGPKDGSSKGVGSTKDVSSVGPSTPDSDSNRSETNTLESNQSNQQIDKEIQSMEITAVDSFNEIVQSSKNDPDNPVHKSVDSNVKDSTESVDENDLMVDTPSEKGVEDESMITKDNNPAEVNENVSTSEIVPMDDTPNVEEEMIDKLSEISPGSDTEKIKVVTVDLEEEMVLDESEEALCNEDANNSTDNNSAITCEATEDEEKTIDKSSVVISETPDIEEKEIDKSPAMDSEATEDEEKTIHKSSVFICEATEVEEKEIDKCKVVICEAAEEEISIDERSTAVVEAKEVENSVIICKANDVEEKLDDAIVTLDESLNAEEEIIDKPTENLSSETDSERIIEVPTELEEEMVLQDAEVIESEEEKLAGENIIIISERENVELDESSNLSTNSEKIPIILSSESLALETMDSSIGTEENISQANNFDSNSVLPSVAENEVDLDETVVEPADSKHIVSVEDADGIDSSSVETSASLEVGGKDVKADEIKSPDISNERIVNNNEDNSKVLTEDIETFDVVEEVVTCETSSSDKVVGTEIDEVVNEDENAQFTSEETQESVESSDDLVAVIDNDTSDAKVSDNDNQNEVITTEVYISVEDNPSSEKEIVAENEVISNSISDELPLEKMECETTVNSIMKLSVEEVEDMEVDDEPETDSSGVSNKVKNDIPLLKTVSSPSMKSKENSKSQKEEVSDLPPKTQTKEGKIPSLEPITLKIYKDNLSAKTDELVSPKKHKSPKLSSDSPRLKTDGASLSPKNKQFEYTLKIAKDANTNIPKATMSPKSSMSPSWKLESSSLSPHSPGESGVGCLKIKLSKPSPSGLSNDLSHAVQNMKQEGNSSDDDLKTEESKALLKQPLEMGSALKLMMEVKKTEAGRTEGSSILAQVLSGSSDSVSRKGRGRPRKDNEINHSPTLVEGDNGKDGCDESMAAESSALDTSGEGSEAGASRQVRSCRARTQPIARKSRKPRGGGMAGTPRGGGRGGARGVARPIATAEEAEKIQEKLSEKEKAELAKIEARKEKMRLDRVAKAEAKKAKKLAKKLKDEERRKRLAAEKAEKLAAAAPQVFEEETRMSASESRGHTPAPSSRLLPPLEGVEESQNSLGTSVTKPGNHKGRMEIPIDPESDEVRVDQLAEYQWQGSELCMIQEQVSLYLGVKSFKRKYPDLRRRLVDAEERTFLEDSGLVPKSMCDLGLTAVSSAEILDIMFQDFPDKYEAFRQHVRDKQAKEMSFKQKALASQTQNARAKGELRELALEAAAMWNSNLNRERREERRCALDLQSFTVNYPKYDRERMIKSPLRPGLYPVSVIPGQFSDYYKTYTPTELMYFPLNTVMYGPLKPNQRRDGSDSSSSSSDDSSGSSDSEKDSEDEESVPKECKICNGEKKSSHEAHPEILLQCSQCKGLCHPTCQEITPEMLPHIKKYSWHCSNCKKCTQCKDASKEEKMLFCDLCDRGYHISCVGLRKSPEGRWHCSVCSFCTLCGSKDPGGPEWFYEYKKTDKGVRLYQRTLCAPCSKKALM